MGVVVAGVVLWRAPGIVPAGWTAEAVLSLGMALGVVIHRLLDAVLGWLVEPMVRHLGARWEAAIQLGKLARYRKRGLIPDGEARELTGRIVRADVTPRRPRRK